MKKLFVAAFAVLFNASAGSEETDQLPRYTLKQPELTTGTNIRGTIASATIPFDKKFGDLTLEQQRQVRSQYERMGPEDEPPFPVNGLGPIYKTIAAAQQKLRVEGNLSVAVEVDSLGRALSVSVFQTTDPKMTQFVAAVLMKEAYKPAVCAGSPCTMQFPFRMHFQTSF